MKNQLSYFVKHQEWQNNILSLLLDITFLIYKTYPKYQIFDLSIIKTVRF